jgi:cysteine synthase B
MRTVTTQENHIVANLNPAPDLWANVGNTPLIPLRRVTSEYSEHVEVYAKAEWYNPSGSIKDRPAAAILRRAVREGLLRDGKIFLDSTSGNMGIAYATLGAALGVRPHIVVPENASEERFRILRAFGAVLTLSDPLEGSDGARAVATEMAASDPDRYYYADQYSNPTNWRSHYETTGPEIAAQTGGRLTHFVAGLGTTGTMMGVGGYLGESIPDARLVAVQPDGPLHGLEGLKHLETDGAPSIFDTTLVDETIQVRTEAAYAMARTLAQQEGLFVGISAAAAAVAALELAGRIEAGVIVAIFPDSGLKYMSQSFWSMP